ncbi:flagellar biosynthesis anti-sigma factor FlgM [Thalassobacillus sp. CUG 92003]|uniref:flagellar biosynthesis anti-sigma factor FlgM n=1 Tax=Thalassobacillus sp. CUG 92003 TaxID=2736641 RepID=UPI0015E7AF76|nr:flagellar biosynthesis anti-sigma factor FlgM [Thalassobacillus sp. CUG 92003]
MRINGPNQTNLNPYQKQINKQAELQKAGTKADKIEISKQAKDLQESSKPDPARQKQVEAIKQRVDAGEYKGDHDVSAQKMIDFWNKRI